MEEKRGAIWPGMQAVIEKRKAELFEDQKWRPGCALCGKQSRSLMSPDRARQWRTDHGCVA